MSTAAAFTIIIPVKRVCALTLNCWNKLRQLHPDLPVIIVSDEAFADDLPQTHVLVHSGTIGEKRNLAARLAQTPYLAFIDSDAEPLPGWPEEALAYLNETCLMVTGPNLPYPDQSEEQRLSYLSTASFLVSGSSRHEKFETYEGPVPKASSCNLVIARATFERVGGMNQKLKTGEDLDLSAKVRKQGRIHFTQRLRVLHRNRKLRGFLRQRFTYGYSSITLWRETGGFSYTLLPFFFLLGITALAVLSPITSWALTLFVVLVTAYFCAVAFEALRVAPNLGTALRLGPYIVIGNLIPGLGTFWYLIRSKFNVYQLYSNDE